MRTFQYHRAADASEAVALVAGDPESAYLGGGTNLVDLMKLGVARPSDMAVALAALDAIVEVLEPGGARQIPLTEFLRLPGDEPDRETTMDTGGLITAVRVPPLSFSPRSTYRKARDQAPFAFAAGSLTAAKSLGF
jgi:CO/xanthine dehydrogenase FAD-binding subunit